MAREEARPVSVSSLKTLRRVAKDSHARRAMIGFGNPLLDGPDASYAKSAAAARSKQSCRATPEQRVKALTGELRGVLPLDLRRGLADVAEIRIQVPLPETADELCAVARDLRASSDDIWLGARATEASHATVKLITGAVNRMAAGKRVGRAEAMRQSMLALIDKGKTYEAHPAFWAPFVVVGEGAAARYEKVPLSPGATGKLRRVSVSTALGSSADPRGALIKLRFLISWSLRSRRLQSRRAI
jgi:hypothetical protein